MCRWSNEETIGTLKIKYKVVFVLIYLCKFFLQCKKANYLSFLCSNEVILIGTLDVSGTNLFYFLAVLTFVSLSEMRQHSVHDCINFVTNFNYFVAFARLSLPYFR